MDTHKNCDEYEGIGSMGGICSVLHQTPAASFVVCAWDMPLMSSIYVGSFLEQWKAIEGENWEDLLALYEQYI